MKKFLALSVVFGFVAAAGVLYSSPRTECNKKCDKEKQACVSKANKTKYETKDGRSKASKECDDKMDACIAGCKIAK